MKKLIIMTTIFLVVMGLAGLDIWFSTTFMGNNVVLLSNLENNMMQTEGSISTEDNLSLANKANDYWEGGKKKYMKIANHNQVRQADEKFVQMLTYIEVNDKTEALASLRTLKSYIKDLQKENYPLLHNIL